MSTWNPEAYLKFEKERTQPSRDLAARIEARQPRSAVDIGCGPGNSTAVLAARWPGAEIVGVDSSPEMIKKAAEEYPHGRWILADASSWQPERTFDVVFSNATIQWIPDHATLIPRLYGMANPNGALAIQVPANNSSPLHLALLSVTQRSEWNSRFKKGDDAITYNSEEYYYDLLAPLSERIELWRTTYYHILESHQNLIDWYSTTGMKVYLSRLENEQDELQFKRQVLEECRPHYPVQRDGRILFPFKRIFMIAYT